MTKSDSFLVDYILCILPHQYAPFNISYNTHKDKWSVNEILTMRVQKEEMLQTKEGKRVKKKGKIPALSMIKKEPKYFFWKKKGHMKKDCPKFKNWLEKKGTPFSFVCYESNIVNVNHNTWWINSGYTIHVSNTLQGLENLRKPMGSEQFIYSGSKMSAHVEAVGTCNLVLSSGFIMHLEKTFYVPSFCKNLIYISRLAPLGFYFNFSDFSFTLTNKYEIVGFGELCNGLYSTNLPNDATYNSIHVFVGLKQCVVNEDSSMLWHQRL